MKPQDYGKKKKAKAAVLKKNAEILRARSIVQALETEGGKELMKYLVYLRDEVVNCDIRELQFPIMEEYVEETKDGTGVSTKQTKGYSGSNLRESVGEAVLQRIALATAYDGILDDMESLKGLALREVEAIPPDEPEDKAGKA